MAQFYEAMLHYDRAWDRPGHVYLVDPSGLGPHVYLQQVPEPRTNKNRLHLDIVVPSLPDAVEQAVQLGASSVEERRTAYTWFEVLADPEGNLFCLVDLDTGSNRSRRGGNTPTSERWLGLRCLWRRYHPPVVRRERPVTHSRVDRFSHRRSLEHDGVHSFGDEIVGRDRGDGLAVTPAPTLGRRADHVHTTDHITNPNGCRGHTFRPRNT